MAISDENDRLTIIISKIMKNELRELAELENRSLSNYIVNILEQHLDDLGQLSLDFENQNNEIMSDEVENSPDFDLSSQQLKALMEFIKNAK